MMNKKYLMKGFVALALVAGFSSCVKDVDGISPAEEAEKAKENAELQLGLNIPDGQTWEMSQQIAANVTVDLNAGETYEVAVYANDPIADGVGKVLAKGTVQNGNTYTAKFTGSKATSQLWVGVTDQNNYTRYKLASVKNGQLAIDFGTSTAAARSMRAYTVEGDTYNINYPTQEEIAAAFPKGVPEADEVSELENLYKGKQYKNQYGTVTASDLYAIYVGFITKGHNLKIITSGEYTLGGGYQNIVNGEYQYYNVYVNVGKGNTVTINRNGATHFNLYVLSGTVNLPSDFGELCGKISVAEGATVNDARNHIAGYNSVPIKVYNRGTYNATNSEKDYWANSIWTSYDIGNCASIYNEGTFTAAGDLSYSAGAGNTSYFYNIGDGVTLSAPNMILNSTCNFITSGTVNITGLTQVTQSGITWINNGHYTTGSLKFGASNTSFYNYCQLKVTGNTWFMDGAFNLMSDSYTEMNTAIMQNFTVNMKNNSGLNIKSGLKCGRQGGASYQGFRTVNNADVAYVRVAGTSYIPSHNGGAVHFMGSNLTYAFENVSFYKTISGPQGKVDGGQIKLAAEYTDIQYSDVVTAAGLESNGDGNVAFAPDDTGNRAVFAEVVFTEPAEGECSATWNKKGEEKIEEPAPVTFAFEDQISNGDYDLNDVVLKITPHVIKTGKKITGLDYNNLDIKLVAAGATFDITVMVDETALSFNGNTEVHDAFGVNRGVMVNTGGTAKSGVQQNAAPVTCTIATPAAVKGTDANGNPTLDLSKLNIWIDVNPGKTSAAKIYYLKEKTVPYAVMIPNDWAWPKERVCIKDAYVGSKEAEDVAIDESGNTFKKNSFAVWAATLVRDDVMNGWYNFPVGGSTMKNK